MARFWDLLERSVIIQAALPVLFGGAVVMLCMQGRAVPDILAQLTWAVTAFWFGTKSQATLNERARHREEGTVRDLR